MDMVHITEMLKLLNRIAVSLEDQAKHQQEMNDLCRQHNIEMNEQADTWQQLQIQWREENQARENQWQRENIEASEKYLKKQILAYLPQEEKQS